jgi:flagellar assembly protein FliH
MTGPDIRAHQPGFLGVLYAEDFDEDGAPPPAAETAPEPEVIEPVFTAAEMEEARSEAHALGRTEAEHGLAASRARMIGLLAAGVANARDEYRATAQHAAEAAVRCVLSALYSCLPALCERHGAAEMRSLTRAVLPTLVDEPRITVRVNPAMLSAMQDEIADLDSDLSERVQLIPADIIAPGDIRINWADGSAIRDTARAHGAVRDALAALGLLEPDLPLQEMADA